MPDQPPISISLSPAQVDAVVRAAANSRSPGVASVIGGALQRRSGMHRSNGDSSADSAGANGDGRLGYLLRDTDDPRLSRSLLRGLSILTCFGVDGAARGIVELAGDLDMSPSTAHRYAVTLVELGLLERCPRTRKYRLPAT
jgi:hypothetical protein